MHGNTFWYSYFFTCVLTCVCQLHNKEYDDDDVWLFIPYGGRFFSELEDMVGFISG